MLYYVCKVDKDNENRIIKKFFKKLKKIVDKLKFMQYNDSKTEKFIRNKSKKQPLRKWHK